VNTFEVDALDVVYDFEATVQEYQREILVIEIKKSKFEI
jgi:hypothetical protein